MNRYIEQAIARTLRIPLQRVGRWAITSTNNGGFIETMFSGPIGAPGYIDNKLEVQLLLTLEEIERLQAGGSGLVAGHMEKFAKEQHPYLQGQQVIHTTFTMLYSKETQHIFKALYQQMTMRGRKPKKGKRR